MSLEPLRYYRRNAGPGWQLQLGNPLPTSFVQDWVESPASGGRRDGAPSRSRTPSVITDALRKAEGMTLSARGTHAALTCGAVALGLLLSGCTSTAEPPSNNGRPTSASSPTEPSSRVASPSSVSPSPPSLNPDYTLTVNIVIVKGKTTPNGEKINVRVGQKVILNVISDTEDEIHAHIGGDGYDLPVQAGTPARGSFILQSPGSFEVESHHLEKIIVILNAH
jgi:hypothetical protein